MGRAEINKQQKQQSLMDNAFELFTNKGIARTSISDIVEKAGMAKGTFYLYFRDKYDLQEKLIAHKAKQLFQHALTESGYEKLTTPTDKILSIMNDILSQLNQNQLLLRFINKNLSWGVFKKAMVRSELDLIPVFDSIFGNSFDQQKLEILLYTIIELIGSTSYSVILDNDPVDFETYRPWLNRAVRAVLNTFSDD